MYVYMNKFVEIEILTSYRSFSLKFLCDQIVSHREYIAKTNCHSPVCTRYCLCLGRLVPSHANTMYSRSETDGFVAPKCCIGREGLRRKEIAYTKKIHHCSI